MANITDIQSILYTEKSLSLQEDNVVVIQTTPKVTKNQLKAIIKEYFGFTPLKVNSSKMLGKVKNFRGKKGKRPDYKKFYVKVPEGAKLESVEV